MELPTTVLPRCTSTTPTQKLAKKRGWPPTRRVCTHGWTAASSRARASSEAERWLKAVRCSCSPCSVCVSRERACVGESATDTSACTSADQSAGGVGTTIAPGNASVKAGTAAVACRFAGASAGHASSTRASSLELATPSPGPVGAVLGAPLALSSSCGSQPHA